VFTKNRDRLLGGNIAEPFFNQVLALAQQHALLSEQHFTVDGTLLEASASHKSFRLIDDPAPPVMDDDRSNPSVNFSSGSVAGARPVTADGTTPHNLTE
jgi:hypothetical protein